MRTSARLIVRLIKKTRTRFMSLNVTLVNVSTKLLKIVSLLLFRTIVTLNRHPWYVTTSVIRSDYTSMITITQRLVVVWEWISFLGCNNPVVQKPPTNVCN
jgi:hypothetical protein